LALCTICAGILYSFFNEVFKIICYVIYYLYMNEYVSAVGLLYKLYVELVQLICVILYLVFKEVVTKTINSG
jgi:hypothetical protein